MRHESDGPWKEGQQVVRGMFRSWVKSGGIIENEGGRAHMLLSVVIEY